MHFRMITLALCLPRGRGRQGASDIIRFRRYVQDFQLSKQDLLRHLNELFFQELRADNTGS